MRKLKKRLLSALIVAPIFTPILTPSLTPSAHSNTNSNSNLKIEGNETCIEQSSLPDGYSFHNLEEITTSAPVDEQEQGSTQVNLVSNEENILTQEEFFQIQERNYRDRSIKTDFEAKYDYNHYIYPLAKIIFAEASICDDKHQQYVGYVVMNRVKSIYYPNTIEDVFFHGDAYAETSRYSYNNGLVSEKTLKNAEIVIDQYFSDSIPVSPAMVYQAEFKQGVKDNYIQMGNTFFCFDQRILDDLSKNSN